MIGVNVNIKDSFDLDSMAPTAAKQIRQFEAFWFAAHSCSCSCACPCLFVRVLVLVLVPELVHQNVLVFVHVLVLLFVHVYLEL